MAKEEIKTWLVSYTKEDYRFGVDTYSDIVKGTESQIMNYTRNAAVGLLMELTESRDFEYSDITGIDDFGDKQEIYVEDVGLISFGYKEAKIITLSPEEKLIDTPLENLIKKEFEVELDEEAEIEH